jgi:hypothetical protein
MRSEAAATPLMAAGGSTWWVRSMVAREGTAGSCRRQWPGCSSAAAGPIGPNRGLAGGWA